MLAFSLLVSGSFVFGSRVAQDIAPMALNAVRFVLAAAVFAAILAVQRRGVRAVEAPWRFIGLGGLMGAYFVLMFFALQRASSVNTVAIFTMTPLLAGFFDWAVNRRRLSGRAWLAVCVGAVGALAVVSQGDWRRLKEIGLDSGEALFFIGCVAHALYIALCPKAIRDEPPEVFTFWVLVGGAMVVGLAGAADLAATPWGALPARVWLVLAYLAIPATTATFLLMRLAATRLPAAKVMAYTYLAPVWVMTAEAVAGSPPAAGAIYGAALVAAALVLLLIEGRRK